MNLRDLMGTMRRRWYLVLAGLVITAAMCLGAARVVPPSYTANASVLLLPPNSTVGTGGNPYLSLGGLQGAVDVLGRAMMSEQIVSELTDGSTQETYVIEPDATTSGPLLVLNVTSRSADGAMALMRSVLNLTPTVLSDLQTEVKAPAESLITASVIAEDTTATTDRKSQIRVLIVALAAGLAATFLLTIVVDAGLRRRSKRTTAEPQEPQSPPLTKAVPTKRSEQSVTSSRTRSRLRAPMAPNSDRPK